MTLLALGLGMGLNTLDPVLLSIKIDELAPEYRNTALGLITASGLLVATLTQPLVGALSDRTNTPLGRRVPYMIAGTLLAVVFLFTVALAPAVGVLLFGVIAYQFASNTAQAPWQALLPDQLPASVRGAASGLKSLFEILGFILGRSLAGYMVAQGTPQTALFAASGVLIATMALTSITARLWKRGQPPPEEDALREGLEEQSSEGSADGSEPLAAFLSRSNWPKGFGWWFINRMLFWAAAIALNSFVIFYMMDVMGMTLSEASRLFSDITIALGVSLMLITIPAGRLSDRIGRRPIILIACLVAIGGNLILLFARTRAILILGGGALGLATGVFLSASWALATDLAPKGMAGRYLGIANIATAGGSFIARFAGGALIDPINRLTESQDAGYYTLYTMTLLAFVLAALAVTRLKPSSDPLTV